MTKVLLVSVPFYRLLGSHFNGINLGLAYLSSTLEKAGIECTIYNADYLPDKKYAGQVTLHNYYESYKEIMSNPSHPIWQECVSNILDYNPQWLGFNMFTANFPAVKIISQAIKRKAPDIKIIVGGPHVTLAKDMVLRKAAAIDFAIQGEGEINLLYLVQRMPLNKIKGLIYRCHDDIVVNSNSGFINDLDKLPFPNRKKPYLNGQQIDTHYIITSRGCPNNCTFCASPVIWKRKVRLRSVKNVIQELMEMKELGHKFIQFQDDTFTSNKIRLFDLLRRMYDEKLDFKWVCDTGLNFLDEEILQAMKSAGCIRVKVGIESGNRDILKTINKNITPELILEKTNLIKKAGLSLTVYFMIGFPGETDEQAMETIELAKKIEADYYSLSVVSPYFGTKLYGDFVKHNGDKKIREHWEYFFHQSGDMILTTNLSENIIDDFWALNSFGKGVRV